MGQPAEALRTRLSQRHQFTVDDIAALLRELPDERLITWLFGRSELVLVRHEFPPELQDGVSLLRRSLDGTASMIEALFTLLDAVERSTEVLPDADIARQSEAALNALLQIRRRISKVFPENLHHSAGRGGAFAAAVRQVILVEKGTSVAELAASLGLPLSSAYARVNGRTSFTPSELQGLFHSYPQPRLADLVLIGTPYTAARCPAHREVRSPRHRLLDGLASLQTLFRLVRVLPANNEPEGLDAIGFIWALNDGIRGLLDLDAGSVQPQPTADGGESAE